MGAYRDLCVELGVDHLFLFNEASGDALDVIAAAEAAVRGANVVSQTRDIGGGSGLCSFGGSPDGAHYFTNAGAAIEPVSGVTPFSIVGGLRCNDATVAYPSLFQSRGPTSNHGVILGTANDGLPGAPTYLLANIGDGTTVYSANTYGLGLLPALGGNLGHVLGMSYDGSAIRAYVDGVLIPAGPVAVSTTPVAGSVWGSSVDSTGANTTGLAIFKGAALSATDHRTLANAFWGELATAEEHRRSPLESPSLIGPGAERNPGMA